MHPVEYEVRTDANIVGSKLTYKSYQLSLWDFGVHRRGQTRLLCLRMEQRESLPPIFSPLPQQFISLVSLFLRRRLILGPITRFDDNPLRHAFVNDVLPTTLDPEPPSHKYVDVDIVRDRDPQTNLQDLKEWLPLVDNLNNDVYDRFISASKLYSEALELMEVRPDVSYLNLVSAVETLAQEVDIGEPTLDDLREGMEELVKEIADLHLRQRFMNMLVEQRFFTRKFYTFIQKCMERDKDFWTYERRPKGPGKIDEKSLPSFLKRIYSQRSRTLHAGEPFPFYVFERTTLPGLEGYPEGTWLGKSIIPHHQEMDEIPTATMMHGGRTWKLKDFIPYPHFFERLVNHVLKNYLKACQPTEQIKKTS